MNTHMKTPIVVTPRVKAMIDLMLERTEDPINNTIGVFARDAAGFSVSSEDRTAVCWCWQGHEIVAASRLNLMDKDASLYLGLTRSILAQSFGQSGVGKINDSLGTHAIRDVIAQQDFVIETQK